MKAAIALLTMAGLPVGAAAQDAKARVAVNSYATCLVNKSARKVSVALDSGFDARFDAAVAALPAKGCGELGASVPTPTALRGALFAAMYRKFGPGAGRSASNLIRNWVPSLPASDPRLGLYTLSACIVLKAPTASRYLIRAKPESEEEKRQMDAVMPHLQACVSPTANLRISRAVLSGLIAETVYRIDFAVPSGERNNF